MIKNFSGIAILPSGEFVVPENATEIDRRLLELMKLRDNLDDEDPQKIDIIKKLNKLTLDNSGQFTVDNSKSYSFYELGEDITERLNDYMESNEKKYAHMHNKILWVLNLKEFKFLVENGGEMDLKNKPNWQKSAFAYNGEIISQDVIGNINYGYFGKFCRIPDIVLAGGGGYAQIMAGTTDSAYFLNLGDDPRDGVRINQGINIYLEQHSEEIGINVIM